MRPAPTVYGARRRWVLLGVVLALLAAAAFAAADPSGFDPGVVSTAADQLRAFQEVMRFPVFRQIVSMVGVTLPVAGTLTNYNPLIAGGYRQDWLGLRGRGVRGLLRPRDGRRATVDRSRRGAGAGPGQRHEALLAAVGEAAQRLVDSVARARVRAITAPAVAGGPRGDAGSPRRPQPPATGRPPGHRSDVNAITTETRPHE